MNESGKKEPRFLAYFRVATKEQLDTSPTKPDKEFEEFIAKREVPHRVRERVAAVVRKKEAHKKESRD